jgi:cytolysin-activating lysine-acyltransferase
VPTFPANELPTMEAPADPATSWFTALGAMVMLDICADDGTCEQSIATYLSSQATHLDEASFTIVCDTESRPAAYATWPKGSLPSGSPPVLLRLCAPFDNLSSLQAEAYQAIANQVVWNGPNPCLPSTHADSAQVDFYAGVGYALVLLAKSAYHQRFPVRDYFAVEILPALHHGQCKFYLSRDGQAKALVTWAWLSEEVEKQIHATGRALQLCEWDCGNRLFFNDWITPYDNIKHVLRNMSQKVFPDEVATSLRRNPDGTVRRINRWTGGNLRKSK